MFKPRQDYLLIRPIVRKQSDVLEVISHEKHCRGEIIAVGPGKFNKKGVFVPLVSQVGQIVIFGNGDFDFYPKYYEDGQVYRIIQEADICAVIDELEAA